MYEADCWTVARYVIGRHYAFFAANVMLVTISITLGLFLGYHILLIKENSTTNERVKRGRNVKYMDLIYKTLVKVAEQKGFSELKNCDNSNSKKLTDEEVKKFKHIAFNGM